MDNSTLTRPDALAIAEKLRAIGISESYASQLSRSVRSPSQALAIRIFRETGIKLGPIAGASKAEIEALDRMLSRRVAA